MADEQPISLRREPVSGTVARPPREAPYGAEDEPNPSGRPRLNKLRLGITLLGLTLLALVSTVFGMMMAVAQDLPELESQNEFRQARNSVLYATGPGGKKVRLATLTGAENRILVDSGDISSNVKRAVVAIEDARFYTHKGVDYRGIARALWEDVRRQRAAQGASTITQQFVKNALVAQKNRSLFQKLKEAALAYQLERKWTKEKILTEYLNTVYFGEGAYGIESAARVYFGWNHPGCEPKCASVLEPAEAALLAGMIASPSSYSPVQNPAVALQRRNLVLQKMQDQTLITSSERAEAERQALPPRSQIQTPKKISLAPYFTAWLEDQLVDRYGSGNAFAGGLKIRTTLDLELQKAAEQAIATRLGGIGPSAALVAIDNDTGGIRAMVGGSDFNERPFNLATQGRRQPGSSFKPFTLIAALEDGISPGRTFVSSPKTLSGPRGDFKVENYEDRYSGVTSLATATTVSDNSVYAEVGYKLVGTRKVAKVAKEMGIRTHVSRNPAMVLGGLKQGVTPLEMAKSYETLAEKGNVVSGSLAPYDGGPVTFTRVEGGSIDDKNKVEHKRAIPENVAEQATQILSTVVSSGTGRAAQIGEFAAGKTGTTENYQDAWFVGFDDDLTVAVWVGYPEGAKPMQTEYRGEPVAGGTFPAEIWHDFMVTANKIRAGRSEKDTKGATGATGPVGVPTAPVTPAATDQQPKTDKSKRRKDSSKEKAPANGTPEATPAEPAPEPNPTPTPAPTPTPPPGGGGSGGSGGTGGTGGGAGTGEP
jgi:penicillin-binding protein 1A